MWKNIYAVRDSVSSSIVSALIIEASDAPAIRAFYDALRTEGTMLAQHPADYDLLCVATFNTDTGEIDPLIVTKTVATGSGWLELQKGL